MINVPMFCITSDIDWASDYCIEDFITLISSYGIKPTIFATHESKTIRKFAAMNKIELGIHPNFLPKSLHELDYLSVIDTMVRMYPEAKTFRSHYFFDSTKIIQEMRKRGICYDSNICLHFQSDLVPLKLADGILRFPVFWEDDSHMQINKNWDLKNYIKEFLTPGLKVLNFHSFNVAVNVPDRTYYLEVKEHIQTTSSNTIDTIRYNGHGVRTFLIELLDSLFVRNEKFYTLSELYQIFDKRKK